MPRKVRNDLSYFTLDCDIFSTNSKLKPLIDRYGGDGLALYIHILCDVYSKGYYLKPNNYEDYLFALAKDIGMSVEKVQLILAFMADRSLLDAHCLNKNTVFTSHGIQERYAEAMKGRKRSVAEIKGEYWLLTEKEEVEIDTFYKSHPNANKSEKIDDKSEKIDDKSEIYDTTEQNRTEQKETYLEVSKKESNKKELESYDEIFAAMQVGDRTKRALVDFIRHLQLNGIKMINDRLETLLVKLDFKYGNDELAKCREIRNAIINGYRHLPCEDIT